MNEDQQPTQLNWPPALVETADGGLAFDEVEQDSEAEIRANAVLLCDVRPGQLVWARKFGTPSPNGQQDANVAAALITAALADQEPRLPIVARVVEDPGSGNRSTRLRIQEG